MLRKEMSNVEKRNGRRQEKKWEMSRIEMGDLEKRNGRCLEK